MRFPIYGKISPMATQTKNAALAIFLSMLLATAGILPFASNTKQAHADELSDAQATLSAASEQLSAVTSEYESLLSQVSELDTQIAETTTRVTEAQTAMLEGQDALGNVVLAQYKSEDNISLVNILISSADINEFIKNVGYYTAIQEDQAAQVAQQKALRDSFTSALEELDSQRDAQQDLLDQAEAKKAEAESVVAEASAKVSEIQEAQAALAELQAQAEAMAAEEEANNSAEIDPGWNTDSGHDSGNSGSSSDSNSNNSSSNNSGSADSSKGWKTGRASAYGGSSDPSTPNPGRTATGAVCDDNSMGVAIPKSMANYRSYFGHAVEISYNGRTVIATINDCGTMRGGRALDLQPGVFKALGFSTCQAWGVRTVSYRIL